MERLRKILESVIPECTIEQYNSKFAEIAELLLNNYAIKCSAGIYRLTEIEFYYYDSKIDDKRKYDDNRNVTYPRTTPAGCWFFHDSGMDISFNSKESDGYGGGILIRGIKKIEPKEEAVIKGPKKCYWKLFDEYVDAFNVTSPNPHIISYDYTYKLDVKKGERIGLTDVDNKQLWRFFFDIK